MPSNAVVTAESTDAPSFWLIAGDCHVQVTGNTELERRGQVIVIIKPDDTVLVHDIAGYKPIAWLTRAETVSIDHDERVVTAVDGDQWLRIDVNHALTDRRFPGSRAGRPVGSCPDCEAPLVHAGKTIHCLGCTQRYGLPSGATIRDDRCDCGLPRMSITRGDRFELCIDRECEPMLEVVADRFDGTWDCPAQSCDGSLEIVHRSGLLAACTQSPECDERYRFPDGSLENRCGCGLPRFRVDGESRCLDVTCGDT